MTKIQLLKVKDIGGGEQPAQWFLSFTCLLNTILRLSSWPRLSLYQTNKISTWPCKKLSQNIFSLVSQGLKMQTHWDWHDKSVKLKWKVQLPSCNCYRILLTLLQEERKKANVKVSATDGHSLTHHYTDPMIPHECKSGWNNQYMYNTFFLSTQQ